MAGPHEERQQKHAIPAAQTAQRIPPGIQPHIMAKQKEEVSGIYGKPNFGLIVGLFAVGIVVLLICGVVFLKFDPLHVKEHLGHRTGMTIVLPLQLTAK